MEPSPLSGEAPAFLYDSLPDDSTYIRLLEVLDVETQVKCNIATWPVESAPPYHAVSYTWGDPKLTTTIIVNNQPFQVRQNCEYVLKQARWHGGNQYHWVDAICIDQSNLKEKGKQVSMMGDIYRRASCVLACVGPSADDSDFLFKTLTKYKQAWVAMRVYGKIISGWKWYIRSLRPILRASSGLNRKTQRRLAAKMPLLTPNLSVLGRGVRRLLCEDPRDRIYGILSIVDWDYGGVGHMPIMADYTKEDFEVVLDFLQRMAEMEENLTKKYGRKEYPSISIESAYDILDNFTFNRKSKGLINAIKARQDCTDKGSGLSQIDECVYRLTGDWYYGRSVLQQEIDDSFQFLFGDNPRAQDFPGLLLPPQTRPGDWLLNTFFSGSKKICLVARKKDLGVYEIIGKGVVLDDLSFGFKNSFWLALDVEDMAVILGTKPVDGKPADDFKVEVKEYVCTKVCWTPGSSYAKTFD